MHQNRPVLRSKLRKRRVTTKLSSTMFWSTLGGKRTWTGNRTNTALRGTSGSPDRASSVGSSKRQSCIPLLWQIDNEMPRDRFCGEADAGSSLRECNTDLTSLVARRSTSSIEAYKQNTTMLPNACRVLLLQDSKKVFPYSLYDYAHY